MLVLLRCDDFLRNLVVHLVDINSSFPNGHGNPETSDSSKIGAASGRLSALVPGGGHSTISRKSGIDEI